MVRKKHKESYWKAIAVALAPYGKFRLKEFRLLFATTAAMMLTTLFAAVSFLLIIFEIMVIFLTILRSTISRRKQDSTHLYPKSNS